MLWRRLAIFPGVMLNFSRSGVSLSLGPRGAKVTLGRKGTRVTAGIPGTGMSWTKKLGGTPPSGGTPRKAEKE